MDSTNAAVFTTPWAGTELNLGGLRVPTPIIQGGMGVGISLSSLSSAVARAGGIGVISAAVIGSLKERYREFGLRADAVALEDEIKEARRLSEGSAGAIGVNVMVAGTRFGELVDAALRAGADAIFAGAGLPLDLPSHLQPGQNTKLVPIISSAKAARLIAKRWITKYGYTPDGFVVEGPKAGGHLGFKKEEVDQEQFHIDTLVAQVREVAEQIHAEHGVRPAVIAAGGIFTGEDIASAIAAGADGVQMSTRFIATEECDADPAFKQALVDCVESDIEIIPSPVGLPGRAIGGPFVDQVRAGERTAKLCRYNCLVPCQGVGAVYCIADALINASRGNLADGFVFVGGNAHRVTGISTVPALVAELRAEYEAARSAAPAAPAAPAAGQ